MSEAPTRDPGLQAERTELSWRRTLLALAVVAVLTTRVLATAIGLGAVLGGVLALLATVALGLVVRLRHRRIHLVVGDGPVVSGGRPTQGLHSGGLLLVLALVVTALAALSGAVVLTALIA